jgi:dihydroorotase
MGAQIGRDANLPVYVHFGQLWALPPEGANGVDADTIIEETVKLLRPGDILAHPFTRHPGGFVNKDGKVHPIVRAAMDMGLKIDVGHGSHFSYKMARKALDAGVVPHTLGADMHGYNTFLPPPPGTPSEHPDEENHPFAGQARFSLTQAMSSMLALGLTLQQVVPMVTSNAAVMAGLPDQIGALKPGMEADVSVLNDVRGRFKLQDNERTEIIAERLLEPAFCLRAGRRHDATAPILPRAVAA